MNREIASLIAFGADALGTSLRALHSTVGDDLGTLRRMSTAWPTYVLDLEEHRDQANANSKVRYSPRQLERAERLCDLFVGMSQFTPEQRRCAVIKALRPHVTWAQVASQVNAYVLLPASRQRLGAADKIIRMRDGTRETVKRTPRPSGKLMSWQECRGHHDSVLATYAYVVSAAEGGEVAPMVARAREAVT